MSKNDAEFKIWKRNWLSISGDKSIYNNEIKYGNELLKPDICHVGVVANFISSSEESKRIIDETCKYVELGYRVFWVVYLIDDHKNGNFVKVKEDENYMMFENKNGFNNILNGLDTVLNKCSIYFEIDDSNRLYKLEENNENNTICVTLEHCVSKLELIAERIFGYRSRFRQ